MGIPRTVNRFSPIDEGFRVYSLSGFKLYPTCGYNGAAIEAARHLISNHSVVAQEIESVIIDVPHEEVLLFAQPQTAHEARFSVMYNVALMLALGNITSSEFDTMLKDDLVLRLMQRTQVQESDERASAATTVSVTLTGGKTVSHTVRLGQVPGSFWNPLPADLFNAKHRQNLAKRFDEAIVARILAEWANLETIDNVRRPMELLSQCADELPDL